MVLTASSSATAFLWSNGDTTISITVSPSSTTTYTVTVSDSLCSVSDSVSVYVADSVIADISTPASPGCAPYTNNFTNNSNGSDYYWDFGNGDTSTQVSPAYTYLDSGTFNGMLIATDSSSCNVKDTVFFTVDVLALAVDAGPDDSICNGASTVLAASSGTTAFLWSNGDTTASITVSPSSTTSYFVTATDGPCSVSDTVEVSVGQPPLAVTISGPSQLCMGSSITLTVQGPGPYMWSTGDNLASITVSPAASTSYWVQSTNNCGTSSDTADIAVTPPPVLQVSDDTTIAFGASATLSASGASSYLWSTGAAFNSITVSPEQSTTYTVTGTDSLGCSTAGSVTVTVLPEAYVVYVPNVFSINSSNSENKRLHVFGRGIESLELIIYDRWGEILYETSDASPATRSDGMCCAYGEGWDGTDDNDGKQLNTSVFAYKLKGVFSNGEDFIESGNITLIR